MTDDLYWWFYAMFGLLLTGLLLALVTPLKLEGISIQLFAGFASTLAAIGLLAED